MTTMTKDRIEKKIVLRAKRGRVWRALTNAQEFGTWFGAKLEKEFAPGARVTGRITIPGIDHVIMDLEIERMEPESLFAFRWHPYAIEPGVDYSSEPRTLVEFRLAEGANGGTELTVTESGFDNIPASRRAKAFEMNDSGWAEQMKSIERHVTA